ncbi:TPA_asm: NurA domain-containing protein [Salmonella enterica subsp. salamae serovar 18:z10:z6]|uniref:NurA domain-containing protein n=1 Tax=Salmonella enterica subsp. salamae serovar 18:z10:z6 TaxID=1967614 RepID=A0A732GHB4_SALER|nr:NurA domain-containing protein [Salmonella enterica subsp. salamae serovar 18:z10:z6]
MGSTSRSNKPNEWAAKINHTHLINDKFIQDFLSQCNLPKNRSEIDKKDLEYISSLVTTDKNPIKFILAVDGGYTNVDVQKNFPSAQFSFFQFGAIMFSTEDLKNLSTKPYIFPEDMQKLHNLQRYKLALPTENIILDSAESLKNSVRKSIYDFFMQEREKNSFIETLKWFIFEEYLATPIDSYNLASNPNLDIGTGKITLYRKSMNSDYTFDSPDGKIYLTDVFRLHEVVDEEQGAAGLLGYLTRIIEQFILIHFIKFILKYQRSLLSEFLFISDGPLSFSGQGANMNAPMRKLCNYLYNNHNINLVGIEKSGAFVDHAYEISKAKDKDALIKPRDILLLSNKYIYKYIIPGDHTKMHYGNTSYYSGKVIYMTKDEQTLVITVPTPSKDSNLCPAKSDYYNLDIILRNVELLRCNMYDNSIVPVAIANKLVSLANHPSKILLEKFATTNIDVK